MRVSPTSVEFIYSNEFLRVLHFRDFLAQQIRYSRPNRRYSISQMLWALVYPIVLGLDRIETASLLRSNGTFQYLTGLPSLPDQQLRRFLLNAPIHLREQLHRANDRRLQRFIHLPEHRSRLLFDLDSTVVTSFGHQEGAEVGYNPRYRGKRSYDPLLCVEANSSFLWDVELRRGDAGTWAGSEELLACCFLSSPSDIREFRARARVSSREQEREGYSIPAQRRLLNEYPRVRGFRVQQEFIDVESAKNPGRKEFSNMLRLLQTDPQCRTVLLEKTDRLYRNRTDSIAFEELIEKRNVEIHLVKEGRVIAKDSRSQDKFMHDIHVAVAKHYSENLREEVKKGDSTEGGY